MPNREEHKLARRREAKGQLLSTLATDHGLHGTDEIAQKLGISADDVRGKAERGELISLEVDGKILFPGFQFTNTATLPHLDDVLRILRGKDASDVAIITFFLNGFNGSEIAVHEALLNDVSEQALFEIKREANLYLEPEAA